MIHVTTETEEHILPPAISSEFSTIIKEWACKQTHERGCP